MNKKSKDKLFKVTISKTRLTARPQLTEGAHPDRLVWWRWWLSASFWAEAWAAPAYVGPRQAAATHGPTSAPPPAQNSDTPLCVTRIFQKI